MPLLSMSSTINDIVCATTFSGAVFVSHQHFECMAHLQTKKQIQENGVDQTEMCTFYILYVYTFATT